jgi:hypothetical protein
MFFGLLFSGLIVLIPFGVSVMIVGQMRSRVFGLVLGEAILIGAAGVVLLLVWPLWVGYDVTPPPIEALLYAWPVPVGMIALVFVPSATASSRVGRTRCPSCDYDLTGNISGTCPECGREITGSS